jgi:cobalt/nickel transport system ATP-binding protein
MSENVFQVDKVSLTHPGGQPALTEVSFSIAPGEAVCLLGANGCGKSTLLRVLSGLAFPTSGKVLAFGTELSEASLRDSAFNRSFRQRVGFLFQDPDPQLFSPTVKDELAFGPLQQQLPIGEVEARVEAVMELLKLQPLSHRSPSTLSGGEKKRVGLAALLVSNPTVLLLDEPFGGLDPRSQVWLIELLQGLRERGTTIIAATHDLSSVEDIAQKAIVLSEDHRLVAYNAASSVLSDRALLLRVNLIHEHAHRHGQLVHVHPHAHGHGHDHDHGHDHEH